jgi:hypothetical protein
MIGRRPALGQRRSHLAPADETFEAIDDLRSFVTLSRTHPTDCGDRQIFVRLDGRETRLAFGEEFTDELRPGLHHMRVHNTLMW